MTVRNIKCSGGWWELQHLLQTYPHWEAQVPGSPNKYQQVDVLRTHIQNW